MKTIAKSPVSLVGRRGNKGSIAARSGDHSGSSSSSSSSTTATKLRVATVAIITSCIVVWRSSMMIVDKGSFSTSSQINLQQQQQQQSTSGSTSEAKCSLTVVLLEPRLPYLPANDTIYTNTLESVAEYVPSTACILLQISVCLLQDCWGSVDPEHILYRHHEAEMQNTRMQQRYDERQQSKVVNHTTRRHHRRLTSTEKAEGTRPRRPGYDQQLLNSCSTRPAVADDAAALKIAKSLIRHRSGPLLTDFWNRGRVRVSVLKHGKYGGTQCDVFHLNNILLSANYWIDEFIPNRDADRVLMIQRDAFLCKSLNLETWKDFVYVGSPWFKGWPWMDIAYKKMLQVERSSAEYSVTAWRDYWKRFERVESLVHKTTTATATTGAATSDCTSVEAQVNNPQSCPLPPHDSLVFPETLAPRQWVGNGGFSLRSRKWMVRMIRLCPKDKVSGLPSHITAQTKCTTLQGQEDMIFSILLTLVGAKIASPVQANFFGMDQNFGWPSTDDEDDKVGAIQEWLGPNAWKDFQTETRELGYGLPIGQHKCFLAFPGKTTGGYGCAPRKWCKYSFNANDRPTHIMDKMI